MYLKIQYPRNKSLNQECLDRTPTCCYVRGIPTLYHGLCQFPILQEGEVNSQKNRIGMKAHLPHVKLGVATRPTLYRCFHESGFHC